jgi:hypothetical protein
MKNVLNEIRSFVNCGPNTGGTNYNLRSEIMTEFNTLFPFDFQMKLQGIKEAVIFKTSYSLSGKTRYNDATLTRVQAIILTGGISYGLSPKNESVLLTFDDMGFLYLDGSKNNNRVTSLLSNALIQDICTM